MWLQIVLQRNIQGIKHITTQSQYIFSVLLLNVNNRDYFVLYIVYHNNNTTQKMIYTYLRELRTCIRREFIIQRSKFLTDFPKELSTSPGSIVSLKFL
jgi:hypothetical protein